MVRDKSRVEKYKQALTVVGALIVFGTFVFKDTLREKAKDAADVSRAADNQFFLSTELDIQFAMLKVINVQCRKDDETIWSSYNERIEPSYGQVFMQVEALKRLVESLPNGENSLRHSYAEIEKQLKKAAVLHDDLLSEYRNPENESKRATDVGAEPILSRLNQFDEKTRKLDHDVDTAVTEALDECNKGKETAERNLKIYTYFSWGLYAAGWSLALFGRLVGIEGIHGE